MTHPLVLYGAGNLGKLARSHLEAVGVPIAMVVDAKADAFADDPDWAGVPVHRPDDVPAPFRRRALLAVSIANLTFAPLQRELLAAGWGRCVPFYDVAEGFRDVHPLSNGWFAESLDPAALGKAADVLAGWADDASRGHHLRFAAWRLQREEWQVGGAEVVPSNRFFIPEVTRALRADERFLDIGAHHGSVTARFAAEAKGRFDAIWTVEPDSSNRRALEREVASLERPPGASIEILSDVIGARAGDVPFHSGLGYASQVSATGREMRPCTDIDSLGLAPSFIKLHIEGTERGALQGGLATIRRHRPIIAATVYHNADGLWPTPFWLMQHLDRYVFLMRAHSWCGTGAVVYAIPRERWA